MNIKIDVESQIYIKDFIIDDLYGNSYPTENKKTFDHLDGWFLLRIPYKNTKNEITSIKINNFDIGYLIYTGYFENNNKKKFQPACAVWEPGEFKIWLHTNVGFYKFFITEQVSNSDYGKNLFDKYMLTVDYSTDISKEIYPDDVYNFFRHPIGPRWWKKDDITRPYKILKDTNFTTINKELLKDEIKKISKVHEKNEKSEIYPGGREAFSLKRNANLPLVNVEEFYGELKKIIDTVGYKSILNISLQYLQPKSAIRIHIDDHLNRESWKYLAGCKKFYWTLTDPKSVYFKIGNAGLLPLDAPTLINTGMHSHSVVNDSDEIRATVLIYGELNDNSSYKNLKIN